jgi:hypothetical protein
MMICSDLRIELALNLSTSRTFLPKTRRTIKAAGQSLISSSRRVNPTRWPLAVQTPVHLPGFHALLFDPAAPPRQYSAPMASPGNEDLEQAEEKEKRPAITWSFYVNIPFDITT